MLAERGGGLRLVIAVDLVVLAGFFKEAGVGLGHFGPDHVASGEVGLLAHGIETFLVVEQRVDRGGRGGGIAERDEGTGAVGEEFGGVPVGGGDDGFAGAIAI